MRRTATSALRFSSRFTSRTAHLGSRWRENLLNCEVLWRLACLTTTWCYLYNRAEIGDLSLLRLGCFARCGRGGGQDEFEAVRKCSPASGEASFKNNMYFCS